MQLSFALIFTFLSAISAIHDDAFIVGLEKEVEEHLDNVLDNFKEQGYMTELLQVFELQSQQMTLQKNLLQSNARLMQQNQQILEELEDIKESLEEIKANKVRGDVQVCLSVCRSLCK